MDIYFNIFMEVVSLISVLIFIFPLLLVNSIFLFCLLNNSFHAQWWGHVAGSAGACATGNTFLLFANLIAGSCGWRWSRKTGRPAARLSEERTDKLKNENWKLKALFKNMYLIYSYVNNPNSTMFSFCTRFHIYVYYIMSKNKLLLLKKKKKINDLIIAIVET